MRRNNYFRFRIVFFLKFLVMFSLLIGYGSVVSVFYPIVSDLFTLISTFLLMFITKSYIINRKIAKVFFYVSVLMFLSMVCTGSSINDYKGIFFRITVVMLIIAAFKNNYKDITKYFVKALWVLVAISMVNFVLITFFPSLFVYNVSQNGFAVYTIGLVFNMIAQSEIMGLHFVRNQSIFWEPGVLQIPINILIYYLLIECRLAIKKAFIPIFILLTTGSTTGLIILAFILIYRFKNEFSTSGKGLLKTLTLSLLIITFIPVLYAEINQKLSGDTKISSAMRMYDIVIGVKTIINNPLVGLGMNQDKYIAQLPNDIDDVSTDVNFSPERGNTNTVLSMMIKFGIPLALVMIIALYKQRLFNERNPFFIIMMLSLSSEPLLVVFFMILLMLSSVDISPSKKDINENIIFNR